MAAGAAFAGGQQSQTVKTQAEIQQKIMQDGPTTGRIDYLTHKDPAAPHHSAAPVNPKLLRPLTQREIGMLLNACIAYPECNSAYSSALERYQAQLRAQGASAQQGE
ncbi:MAG: hypothetical protein ACREPP_09140 [Rhodanobacteraceae bacterium]